MEAVEAVEAEQVLTVRKRLGRTRTWDLTRAGQDRALQTSGKLLKHRKHPTVSCDVFEKMHDSNSILWQQKSERSNGCNMVQQVATSNVLDGLFVNPLLVQEFLVPEVDNAGDFNAAGRP